MDWCSGCGSRAPTDATFCPACGLQLPVDGAQRTIEAALLGAAGAGTPAAQRWQGQQVAAAPTVDVARGWYPDPAGVAPLRWWTGECWSGVVIDHPEGSPAVDGSWDHDVAPSWLPDPWRRAAWRWWDGVELTGHLSEGVATWHEPVPRPASNHIDPQEPDRDR